MEYNLNRSSGEALIAASLLMVFTMALHPVGGNFEHLVKVSALIVTTHSIAIIAVPIITYGFWGLANRLKAEMFLSTMAFIVMSFGLIAVMFAAAANGLLLPMFVKKFAGGDAQTIESIKPIIVYDTLLNHAFDFIFIGAACISVLLWSIAILRTGSFSKWIGWLGCALTVMAMLLLINGFIFVDLSGFRIFTFGLLTWILLVGYSLLKRSA